MSVVNLCKWNMAHMGAKAGFTKALLLSFFEAKGGLIGLKVNIVKADKGVAQSKKCQQNEFKKGGQNNRLHECLASLIPHVISPGRQRRERSQTYLFS